MNLPRAKFAHLNLSNTTYVLCPGTRKYGPLLKMAMLEEDSQGHMTPGRSSTQRAIFSIQ
jgi:hypothetical protein